jgi:hypothetical protein
LIFSDVLRKAFVIIENDDDRWRMPIAMLDDVLHVLI